MPEKPHRTHPSSAPEKIARDHFIQNPTKLIDSYRPQEIMPLLQEVKLFLEGHNLMEPGAEGPHHGPPPGHHRRGPTAQAPAAQPETPQWPF